MITQEPSILIIEDNVSVRNGLQLKLLERGFYAEGVESIAGGKNTLAEKGENFDVILIDMRLDHYEDSKNNIGVLGADLVIEFFKKNASKRDFQKPEPIILSGFRDEEFYQKALQLGAATYLVKPTPSEVVIRHLRALAIKRLLSNNVDLVDEIENIVLKSRDEAALYDNLCSSILGEVFSACLGSPFILLLTQFDNLFPLVTKNCAGGDEDFPVGEDDIYKELLFLMYRNSNVSSKPFVLNDEEFELLKKRKSSLSDAQINRLKGAAFISLPLAGNFRLSIGILESNNEYSEPPEEMANLLISYVNPATIMFLGEITARWHKNVAEKNTTIKKLATFCNNVGKEQLYILEDANLMKRDSDDYLDSKIYRQIKSLAEDLHHTGRVLEPISEKDFVTSNLPTFSMRTLIDKAWYELNEEHKVKGRSNFLIEGDCQVQGEEEEFFLIAFRFLHWFSRRKFEVPENVEHFIKVTCSMDNSYAVITFEDNSYRIPEQLMEKLFNPFSPAAPPPTSDDVADSRKPGLYLALYLSQIIVEEKYRGRLRQCSEELGGEMGHKIEMKIPLPN